MPWIKKNLVLVVSGVVALVLLAAAVMFLLSNIRRNAEVIEQLERTTGDLQRLVGKRPYPTEENIAVLNRDLKNLDSFLKEVRQVVPLMGGATNLSNRDFKAVLETAIADLQRRSTNAGIFLPQPFDFGFGVQRRLFQYEPGSIPKVHAQLEDVKAICDVLIVSRVNMIESIRRVAMSRDDDPDGTLTGTVDPMAMDPSGMGMGGGRGGMGAGMNDQRLSALGLGSHTGTIADEFLHGTAKTNGFIVTLPYEVIFQGFTEELTAVFSNLLKSENLLNVTSVSVEPGNPQQIQFESTDMSVPRTMMRPPSSPRRMPPGYGGEQPFGPGASRPQIGGSAVAPQYGGEYGGLPTRRPPPVRQPPMQQPGMITGPVTVLGEIPLRVTLMIESVRRLPEETASDPFGSDGFSQQPDQALETPTSF